MWLWNTATCILYFAVHSALVINQNSLCSDCNHQNNFLVTRCYHFVWRAEQCFGCSVLCTYIPCNWCSLIVKLLIAHLIIRNQCNLKNLQGQECLNLVWFSLLWGVIREGCGRWSPRETGIVLLRLISGGLALVLSQGSLLGESLCTLKIFWFKSGMILSWNYI